MLSESSRSVYIHIPFCKTICSYCDFCKFYLNEKWINEYLKALKNELEDRYMEEPVKTIYVGGGTPSALPVSALNDFFEIIKKLKKEDNIEFTFECNIGDISKELIECLVSNGVNRLSIGIQSFDKKNLEN